MRRGGKGMYRRTLSIYSGFRDLWIVGISRVIHLSVFAENYCEQVRVYKIFIFYRMKNCKNVHLIEKLFRVKTCH